ncbi:MAG TPA: histidine kinase dimerization/phospho-acceptor domain-containing protein [Gaiellaceae bacterium]
MTEDRYARLVAIACHDLRTPLATVHGFARTLQRVELADPAPQYVEMIEAATTQLADLLDELTLVTRIQEGKYEPKLTEIDLLELARSAAEEVHEDAATVEGAGALVRVDEAPTRRALGQLMRAVRRHGGLEAVSVRVDGPVVEIGELTKSSAPVVLGEQLRELQAAAAVRLVDALGGTIERNGDSLRVTLPAAG